MSAFLPSRLAVAPVSRTAHGPPRLPSLKMRMSSRIERHRLPSFLVVNKALGHQLEAFVGDFVQTLQSACPPGPVHIGTAWGTTQEPGITRTLRIAHSLKPGHSLAVDVTLRAQGDELYVRLRLVAKTLIARLHQCLFFAAFITLWSLLYGGFLMTTDAHYALGQSYAQKYFPRDPQAGVSVMVLGWDVNAVPGASSPFKRVKPMAISDYLLVDPVLFLQSLATVPALLAAVVASVLMLIPRSAYRYPCLWLGWPTPDDFDTALLAHKGWVERLLYGVLEMHYGVTRAELIEVPTQ